MVHAGVDVLHRLRHERSPYERPREGRENSFPAFVQQASQPRIRRRQRCQYLIQSDEMIAHIAEHVLLHGLWEKHERARILSGLTAVWLTSNTADIVASRSRIILP